MNILSIDTIHRNDDGGICVVAVIEDAVQTHGQTLYDPAEYGPALCTASFYLEEGEKLPSEEDGLIDYLEQFELDWEPLAKDWDY